MSFQQIFAPEPQQAMGFAQVPQSGLEFPLSLAERYQPTRLAEFIGLERPKAVLTGLLRKPRACSLLFVGPPGAGKTVAGIAFATELGGSLKHLAAQKCDVARIDSLRDEVAYAPKGGWWTVLIDEADGMTDKAQLALLSCMDGTAALKPTFGGGFERGAPPPVVYVFTCNGWGPKQTEPPISLLPRFKSRCMQIEFDAATEQDLAGFLERIWKAEGGSSNVTSDWFRFMARGVGVRDALMRMDTDLLAGPRPIEIPVSTAKVVNITNDRGAAARKAWETRRARAGAR
jgi:hypothetical protein